MSKGMKRYSEIQEKRIAKNIKGKKKIGSGAINITGLKGDVDFVDSTEWDFLVEAKTRAVQPGQETRSITFKKEWIKEVQNHAFEQGKSMGVVAISFDNLEDFYTLGSVDFINMKDALIQYEKTLQDKDFQIETLSKVIACLISKHHGDTAMITNRYFNMINVPYINIELDVEQDMITVQLKDNK
jgi:hypothetical protein